MEKPLKQRETTDLCRQSRRRFKVIEIELSKFSYSSAVGATIPLILDFIRPIKSQTVLPSMPLAHSPNTYHLAVIDSPARTRTRLSCAIIGFFLNGIGFI